MALTAQQHAAREGKITASFAPALMAGDDAKILSEWHRVVGDPNYEPDDLSDSWPVQFGAYIESFALDWHERKTARPLTRRGESVVHPQLSHVGATLDAFREDDGCVIDCKAPGAYRKLDDVCAHYTAQMIVQAGCTEAKGAALLIVHGGAEPQEHPIAWDADYEREVWERIAWFWRCVEEMTPPVSLPAVAAPVPPEQWRTVDMAGSNAWAANAADWLAHRAAAKSFSTAEKEIKALLEPDVGRAFGAGVECKRGRNGALRIGKMKGE